MFPLILLVCPVPFQSVYVIHLYSFLHLSMETDTTLLVLLVLLPLVWLLWMAVNTVFSSSSF
jgi:hypothetical protein